jgi:4'-phosphopantetheinyl transferase
MTPLLRSATGDPFELPWPAIADGEVFCAGFSIGDLEAWWPSAWRRASAFEKAHAGRFLRREDALRHLAGRAAWRSLLAAQLGGGSSCPAEFAVNAWGKPQLADRGWEFSISHSGDEVWLAAARAMPVGIDVQQDETRVDGQDLGEAVFHPLEAAAIRGLAPAQGQAAFRRCWVRKEAVLKATGRGLSVPLSAFAVAVDDRPQDWLTHPPAPGFGGPWRTQDLPAPAGYAAALAAMGAPQRISVWRIELPAAA